MTGDESRKKSEGRGLGVVMGTTLCQWHEAKARRHPWKVRCNVHLSGVAMTVKIRVTTYCYRGKRRQETLEYKWNLKV